MSDTRCQVVLVSRLAVASLACGRLCPQPRWSNSTMRYRTGSNSCLICGIKPPPGPPCSTTTGRPAWLPHSSQ